MKKVFSYVITIQYIPQLLDFNIPQTLHHFFLLLLAVLFRPVFHPASTDRHIRCVRCPSSFLPPPRLVPRFPAPLIPLLFPSRRKTMKMVGCLERYPSYQACGARGPRADGVPALQDVPVEQPLRFLVKGQHVNGCGASAVTPQRHFLRIPIERANVFLDPT